MKKELQQILIDNIPYHETLPSENTFYKSAVQEAYELGLKENDWVKIEDEKPKIGMMILIWFEDRDEYGDLIFFGPEYKQKLNKLKFTHWKEFKGPK